MPIDDATAQPDPHTVETYLLSLQDRICATFEHEEPKARFIEDAWAREAGGGGRTRVLSGG
nr:coproporphyrinogen III oxidase [Gammaproteobacteria bacterium]